MRSKLLCVVASLLLLSVPACGGSDSTPVDAAPPDARPAVCGDGVLTPPETCDTALTGDAGAGACPATCDDQNACTTDTLVNPGTCQATCTHTTITAPTSGDGCCPAGANNHTDSDCAPVCGNHVIEMNETCDDGNTVGGDGCSATCQTEATLTGFRFDTLNLRDPHIFIFGCLDITNSSPVPATFAGVNPMLLDELNNDSTPPTGYLGLSPLLVFAPLNQTAGQTTEAEMTFGRCTAPAAGTTCSDNGANRYPTPVSNLTSGPCLGKLPGTTTDTYTPAWSGTPAGACFVSDPQTITVDLSSLSLTLHDARMAAIYSGNPATGLTSGLLRGFISEADADATLLPASLPLIGSSPLSSVLAGGKNGCTEHDDRDTGPDGVTRGWYFYLNFTAVKATYTGK